MGHILKLLIVHKFAGEASYCDAHFIDHKVLTFRVMFWLKKNFV